MKAKLVVAAAAVLIAWVLKRHYAGARPDELWWILSPTARLAGVITATPFEMQMGEGYLSRERLFLIEKSCAGVNFMVAAFGMLMFALFHRVGSPTSAARLLGANLAAAYAAAVMVNTVRIAIAMWSTEYPVALATFNAADIHRIQGIAVYFGGLVLLYELTQRFDRRSLGRGAP